MNKEHEAWLLQQLADLDTTKARLAEAERTLADANARGDMLQFKLAEAEALLRECKLDQWENVEEMAAWRDDRDAFLAAD